MYRSSLSLVLRQGARSSTRSLHLTSALLASKPAHEPASSQGHTTEKAHTTLHKDADVQSASVRAGQDAKNKATGRGTGEDEPFDAARQGNTGGETKGVGAKGPFADQIGGQDEPHKGAGVKKGGSEVAAGYTVTETLKNKVESFIGGGKENRAFSTSTRILASTLPKADPAGARKPKDSKVQGDQNAHLKHTEGGSQGKKGHGNASPDPSLPSKSKSSSKSSSSENKVPEKDRPSFDKKGQSIPGQVRVFSTSSRALADPNAPGVDAPRPAEKDAQTQAGLRQQPRGDDVEHGGAAGQPSNKSQGAPESAPNPLSGTAAPDPEIPKSQKEGATREGMGVRKFSTFSVARASSPPGGYAKSTKHESTSAGYNAPATALPSGLKSAYQEQDPAAVQGASSDLTPSSKAPYSSSAVDPPNEALRKQVLDGTLPEKNPQPDSEFGRLGNKEAWKHRKLS